MAMMAWAALAALLAADKPTREDLVRNDRKKIEADGFWIYNDLPRGLAEARRTGKPLFVALRCVPCHECVKLDDELVEKNPAVRPLLEDYVRVRLVSTNGMDLALFQYDYDQSFAAFLLNADGTIYGRFGTRSHRTEWLGDVSLPALAGALQAGLEIHRGYPGNAAALAGKRGPAPAVARPELFPSLAGKYKSAIDFNGQVAQSCIHCHQVGEAGRRHALAARGQLSDEELFPYPHPKSQGLTFDPEKRPTVKAVAADSSAAAAGFAAGDEVMTLSGQPLAALADVQWALHHVPGGGGTLPAVVRRGGKEVELQWKLAPGWRRADDISWRASTWMLRQMAFGGMSLETVPAAERAAAGVPEGGMALRAKHVGDFGEHARAKRAGLRKGDIVVAWGEAPVAARETDLLAYLMTRPAATAATKVEVLRNGKRQAFSLAPAK